MTKLHGLVSWSSNLDRIVGRIETFFSLAKWSHLQVFPRSYRGSRRNVFQIGYGVSPAMFSSIISWLAQKRLSHWLQVRTPNAFLDHIGLDHGYKKQANCTTFVVDMNVSYLGEVLEGDPLRFTTQLINSDEKRLHYFHRMYHAEKGFLAATNELMTVHINLETRRVAPIRDDIQVRIDTIRDRHATLPFPEKAGRLIGIRSNSGAA